MGDAGVRKTRLEEFEVVWEEVLMQPSEESTDVGDIARNSYLTMSRDQLKQYYK